MTTTTTVSINNLTCRNRKRKAKFDRKSVNFLMKYLFVKRLFFMANDGSQVVTYNYNRAGVNNADTRGIKRGRCEGCDCDLFEKGEGIACAYCSCPAPKHLRIGEEEDIFIPTIPIPPIIEDLNTSSFGNFMEDLELPMQESQSQGNISVYYTYVIVVYLTKNPCDVSECMYTI